MRFTLFSCYLLLLSFWLFTQGNKFTLSLVDKDLSKWLSLFLGYLMLSAVSLILEYRNPADGIYQWLLIFDLGVAVFLFSRLFQLHPEPFTEVVKGLVILASVSVLYGYFQFLYRVLPSGYTHQTSYLLTATYANKNIFAEVLCILLPFLVYALWKLERPWQWLSGFAFLSSLLLIILSLSRSAWVSILLTSFSIILVFLVMQKKMLITYLNYKRTWIILIGIFTFVTASLVLVNLTDKGALLQKQVHTLTHPTYGSARDRLILWQKTLLIAKEKPFWGNGLGTWRIDILNQGNQNLKSADNTTFYQRPHNDYLWVLVEQGIFALALLLVLYVLIIKKLITYLKNNTVNEERFKAYTLLAALLMYLSLSVFAFPKERIEHNIFLAAIIALAYTARPADSVSYKLKSYILAVVLIILGLGTSVFAGFTRMRSEALTRKALRERDEGRWDLALLNFQKAENILYHLDPMSTPLKWYQGLMYYNLGDKVNALRCFSDAYLLVPYHPHVLNNLATCYIDKGDIARAIPLFEKAIALSPSFTEARVNLASLEFNAGNLEEAYQTIILADTSSQFGNYRVARNVILRTRALKYINSFKDPDLLIFAEAILKEDNWTRDIFYKAINNHRDFNEQLVRDIIWVARQDKKDKLADRFEKNLSLKYEY
ncbi:MAG: O-antigen ligase family protein [Bacteroidales bacterium]